MVLRGSVLVEICRTKGILCFALLFEQTVRGHGRAWESKAGIKV